jgi:peptidoglycan/xylan/chitin deacetylase (PgdA/CDA1 family)
MLPKTFYLTFDGSPNPPATDRLLQKLASFNIQASFFMEGFRLGKEAECAKRVLDAGHDVGNHSYHHPQFDEITLQECISEVEMTQEIIFQNLGFYPKLLRPPAGILTAEVEQAFLERGFDIILWSYSVKDWEGPDAASVSRRILDQAFPGAIIACHDKVEWLTQTLDIVIPALLAQGYEFRKLSQIGAHGTIRKQLE